jgi:hypothetical protein
MNLRIIFTVFLGIFVSLVIFYFIMNWYPSNFDPTYTWVEHIKNKSDKSKILLFGSSNTGTLDTDYIQKYLIDRGLEYEIYNLAQDGDLPTRRADTIGYIGELKPEMILYGIDIRMFEGQPFMVQEQMTALQITEIKSIMPNTKNIFENTLFPLWNNDFFSKFPKSPKIITLQTIKHFVRDSNNSDIDIDSNKPFTNIAKKINQVIELKEIKKEWKNENPQFYGINPENNIELNALKNIIKEIKNKNIKIVIFTTPKSSVYLNWINENNQEIFNLMLKDMENLNISVYTEYDKYANYNIWTDATHVVENNEMYSEDIAKIILKELEK